MESALVHQHALTRAHGRAHGHGRPPVFLCVAMPDPVRDPPRIIGCSPARSAVIKNDRI